MSPILYSVFGHVGVTINYLHKKGAILNNQKNLRNAIDVFRTTNAQLQSKYNEKDELIFFDFPQHTLNNKFLMSSISHKKI